MDQTTNLSLPYILAAQAQKHITHNEALRKLDAIVQLAVVDRNLAAPPGAPTEGARYIIAAAPTGAWAGHANHVAAYQDGAWAFSVPNEGWLAWISDEDVLVSWSGTAWATVSGGGGAGSFTTVGINSTADATNKLALAADASLFNHNGAGHQLKVNKAAAANTASLLFQDAFSGRAEMGLTGDDDFHLKVSADGATWNEALVVNRTTGKVAFPKNSIWTAYTPTVTPGSGSFGTSPPTATGSYLDAGPLRYYSLEVNFPANYSAGGPTAGGWVSVSLAAAASAAFNGIGREAAVVGTVLLVTGAGSSASMLALVSGGFVGGNSNKLTALFYVRMA